MGIRPTPLPVSPMALVRLALFQSHLCPLCCFLTVTLSHSLFSLSSPVSTCFLLSVPLVTAYITLCPYHVVSLKSSTCITHSPPCSYPVCVPQTSLFVVPSHCVSLAPLLCIRLTMFVPSIHPSSITHPSFHSHTPLHPSINPPSSILLSIFINLFIHPSTHIHHPSIFIHPSIHLLSIHPTKHLFTIHPSIHISHLSIHSLSSQPSVTLQILVLSCLSLNAVIPSALVLPYSRSPCLSSLESHPFPVFPLLLLPTALLLSNPAYRLLLATYARPPRGPGPPTPTWAKPTNTQGKPLCPWAPPGSPYLYWGREKPSHLALPPLPTVASSALLSSQGGSSCDLSSSLLLLALFKAPHLELKSRKLTGPQLFSLLLFHTVSSAFQS